MSSTPSNGKWHAIEWRRHAKTTVVVDDVTVATGKRVIADCETEEDARLIAAARELLEVAELFLDGIERGHIKCAPCVTLDPNATQIDIGSPAERLRSAIAKAAAA